MVSVSEIKKGTALRVDGRICKVLDVIRSAGNGEREVFIELKLKDIRHGQITDKRYKHTEKLEPVELIERQMEHLYHDSDNYVFMDPCSYTQVSVPRVAVRSGSKFLREGSMVVVEMVGEEPIGIEIPKIVELKIAKTGPLIGGGPENTMKPAMLENGTEILVPQFIVTGDVIEVDTEESKYLDRVISRKNKHESDSFSSDDFSN